MKQREIHSLHTKSLTELQQQVRGLYQELRTQAVTSQDKKGKNVHTRRTTRDDIARLLSVIAEKEQHS